MKRKIKILMIEETDAQVNEIISFLTKAGYDPEYLRTNSQKELKKLLLDHDWDAIISGYSLTTIDVMDILAILNQTGLDIPYFVVIERICEERAIALMYAGVKYCFLKNKLNEMPGILQKEINDARIRRDDALLFEKVERAKQEWEATVDAIQEIILLTDIEGKIIRVNEKAILRFETTYLDLIGTNIEDLLYDTGQDDENVIHFFGEMQIPGIEGWFEVTSYAVFLDDSLHGIVYLFTDITERKIDEARQEHFNQLAGFGSMLATIIESEFIQPVIDAGEIIQQTRMDLESGQSPQDLLNKLEYLQRLLKGVENKQAAILKRASGSDLVRDYYQINDIIVETLNILHKKIDPTYEIVVKLNIQENLPEVFCDAEQISLALLYILENSIDACSEGGTIDIHTELSTTGAEIQIKIIDNGSGFDEELLSEVFQPFISIHKSGNSIGLGLTYARDIIEKHDGHISINNLTDGNHGSITTIKIPC